jgi:hypothetical protein
MEYRIPSLLNADKLAYVVHTTYSDLWDMTRRSECLAEWAGKYETLGDGMVQHAPEYPCKPADMGDFLASVVAYGLDPANRDAGDMLLAIARQWNPGQLGRDDIAFAATVKHNPEKKTYYNIDARKVSAAESRKHDRRWVEVCEWMNGGIASVFGILNENKVAYPTLDAMGRYERICAVLGEINGIYYGQPVEFMRDRGAGLGDFANGAYVAFSNLVESARSRDTARRMLENWSRNVERETGVAPCVCC